MAARLPFALRIRALLWAHDPIGLAAVGAPTDEYAPEAETILTRIPEARDDADMTRIVAEEFARWFSPEIAGDPGDYAPVGAAIWHLVHGQVAD